MMGMPGMPGMPGHFSRNRGPSARPRMHSRHHTDEMKHEINAKTTQHKETSIEKPSPIIKNIEISLSQAYAGCKIPLEINRKIIERDQTYKEIETLYVNIPMGIDSNEMILLEKKGNITHNVSGDVKIFIKIKNRTNFIREGLDLIYVKKITLKESLCGFKFNLKYIDGREFQLNNESGNIIEPNYKKILKNYGMKRDNMTGNLIIEFQVEYPKQLSKEQLNKLNELL